MEILARFRRQKAQNARQLPAAHALLSGAVQREQGAVHTGLPRGRLVLALCRLSTFFPPTRPVGLLLRAQANPDSAMSVKPSTRTVVCFAGNLDNHEGAAALAALRLSSRRTLANLPRLWLGYFRRSLPCVDSAETVF